MDSDLSTTESLNEVIGRRSILSAPQIHVALVECQMMASISVVMVIYCSNGAG